MRPSPETLTIIRLYFGTLVMIRKTSNWPNILDLATHALPARVNLQKRDGLRPFQLHSRLTGDLGRYAADNTHFKSKTPASFEEKRALFRVLSCRLNGQRLEQLQRRSLFLRAQYLPRG